MREIEQAYVDKGGCLEHLTEQVGEAIARFLYRFYPSAGRLELYLGKGNNATDALIAARHLQAVGWTIEVHAGFGHDEWSEQAQSAYEALKIEDGIDLDGGDVLFLDGLIGIGGRGKLRSPLKELAAEMNARRAAGEGRTVAIDLPSGIDADSGEVLAGAVQADLTLAVGAMKYGLVQEGAINHVGRLAELQMLHLDSPENDEFELLTAASLSTKLPVREFDTHKGMAGRVGVLVGHEGMKGAANLAARAALTGGAGLVTQYCLPGQMAIMESVKPDEVMVKAVDTWRAIRQEDLGALVIGPGLGKLSGGEKSDLWRLIRGTNAKLVLDAGVMEMIGESGRWAEIPSDAVLTPHPGEMRRLLPQIDEEGRLEQVRDFMSKSGACLLFKGARTLVAQRDEKIGINTTGTPGMATPGQGDLLAGLIAALLASGIESYLAAKLAAWLAGRAGEIAEQECGLQAMKAGDSIARIGSALKDLRDGRL